MIVAAISIILLFISFIFFRYTIPVAPAICGTLVNDKSGYFYRLPPEELRPEEEDEEDVEPDEDEPELWLPPEEYDPPEL